MPEIISDRPGRELAIVVAEPQLTVTRTRHGPAQAGTEPHVHREHVDAFYVLEGELTFTLGPAGESLTLGAGGFVAVPPGVVHAFVNASEREACWLNFHAPDAGFADYLRGTAGFDSYDPPPDGGRPPAEAVVAPPGAGERAGSALIKGELADLTVVEWDGEPGVEGRVRYGLPGGRTLTVHAPGGGVAATLRG